MDKNEIANKIFKCKYYNTRREHCTKLKHDIAHGYASLYHCNNCKYYEEGPFTQPKSTIENARENVSKFINKVWAEYKAEELRNSKRRKLEQEAFDKAYHTERIKLKAVEGRIKAKSEIFPTQRALESDKGAIPNTLAHAPIDKTSLETGHPVTRPDTIKKVTEYMQRT